MTSEEHTAVSSNPAPDSSNPRSRKVAIFDGVHGQVNPAFDVSGNLDLVDLGNHVNGDVTSSKADGNDDDSLCTRCREKKIPTPWQPPLWGKLCHYSYCPSYRQFSRIISISLIGFLAWFILYSIVGDTAAPNGQLFQIGILSLGAYLAGWLVLTLTTLPRLIGMLFCGVLFQNINLVNLDSSFSPTTKELRKMALVVVMIRTGLDLDAKALQRLKWTTLKICLSPWTIEVIAVAVASHFLLDLPWSFAFALGSIVVAISPAVLVPAVIRLRSQGYGVAKGLPTLMLAIASIDVAISVGIFGILKGAIFTDSSVASLILQGSISIIGGIGFSILWGFISNYFPEKHDPFVIPLRILLLLIGGTVSIFGSEVIGYGGAGPLACVCAAFTSMLVWSRQGWEIKANPATTAFDVLWVIFEPILFGIAGALVKLNELDGEIVGIGVGILGIGIIMRIITTIISATGSNLNMKEKLFIAIACSSKATVQAALGPVCISLVAVDSEEYPMAEKILMVSVLAIILTAPTGAILITILGPRMLDKAKAPLEQEVRRSNHPKGDISTIYENEGRDNNGLV